MAISIKKYVNITSGVAGGAAVARRELIGRLFSSNELIPTGSFVEFDNLIDVGVYFGTGSEEYERAALYFGFISKNITAADKISFAYYPTADSAAKIFGESIDEDLAFFQAISDGSVTVELGGDAQDIAGLDFTTDLSFADVAATIQVGVQAIATGDFTGATVTYDAVKGSFNLVGGSVGVSVVGVGAGQTGTDIQAAIGWIDPILSDGAAEESPVQTFLTSAAANNNFGSFLFVDALTSDEVVEVAEANATLNVEFMFCVGVLAVDTAAYSAALINVSGTALTLIDDSLEEYDEMVPMIVLAATDYSKRNSVQNYMFQQLNLTAKVSDNATSNDLDAERVNYYGETQTAGQQIAFYQRGYLMGLPTSPVNMNVYANEMWFKDAVQSELMTILLALKISANDSGRAQCVSTIQGVINEATFNGTISVGKVLNNAQKLVIAQITGDENAYLQVESIGYWIDCIITSEVKNGLTEYSAEYILVYSKDDVIRSVEGRHVLV